MSFIKHKKTKGFTLIELVIVILVLGLLAAVALPKFISVSSDARTSALEGVKGGFTTAIALVHAKWVASGDTSSAQVVLSDSSTVAVTTGATGGWPEVTSGGLQDTATALYARIMQQALPTTNWTSSETSTTVTFTLSGTGGGSFTYNEADGKVCSGTAPCT